LINPQQHLSVLGYHPNGGDMLSPKKSFIVSTLVALATIQLIFLG